MISDDAAFDASDAEDGKKRTLLTIAEGADANSRLSLVVREIILFHKLYKINQKDPHVHKSATCIVTSAEDYSTVEVITPVVLKFMRNKDQFERELAVRKGLDAQYVIAVIRSYNSENDVGFADAIKTFNNNVYTGYPYCIVLPRASRGLHEVITHDHIAGVPGRIHDVKAITRQVAEALQHIHDKGFIHAVSLKSQNCDAGLRYAYNNAIIISSRLALPPQDLKPLNVMKVDEVWKLIDLDAAAKVLDKAGLKSSTGYAPPELLTFTGNGEVTPRDPTQNNALTANRSFDIWSLGALLYLLITGQTLLNNNQEDNLDEHDLIRLCKWNDDDLRVALRKVHNLAQGKYQPLGRDLLEKLLQPKADKRPKTMDDVLDHPFFTGNSDGSDDKSLKIIKQMGAKMDQILQSQERQEKLLAKIDERTIRIEAISDQTYLQLRKTEQVLLRGMFEATEVTRPTSFIITPNLLDEKEVQAEDGKLLDKLMGADGVIYLAADGSGLDLGERGKVLMAKVEKGQRWFSEMCSLGSKIASGSRPIDFTQQVKEQMEMFAVGKLKDQVMYLYLIDEYTGEPVNPFDDVYPIKITTPSEHAKWMLPIMRTGLKLMAVVNGAALVGSIFGLPIPRVPGALQEKAYNAVGKLDKKSSVAEFDVLQQTLDSEAEDVTGSADKKQEGVRGLALREFERFIDEHDPNHTFASLQRVVSTKGQACWTTMSKEQIEAAEEERKLQGQNFDQENERLCKRLVQLEQESQGLQVRSFYRFGNTPS
jgi:serine/threonine protein kinase